jgi:hypothetical protein
MKTKAKKIAGKGGTLETRCGMVFKKMEWEVAMYIEGMVWLELIVTLEAISNLGKAGY